MSGRKKQPTDRKTWKKRKPVKHKGDMGIGSMLIMILTLMMALILIMAYTSWHSKLAAQDSIYLTVGTYLKAIESSGCLTEEQKEQLVNELERYGMENINLEGTTLAHVPYGSRVTLRIRGRVHLSEVPDLIIENNDIRFSQDSYIEVDILRSGTSFS